MKGDIVRLNNNIRSGLGSPSFSKGFSVVTTWTPSLPTVIGCETPNLVVVYHHVNYISANIILSIKSYLCYSWSGLS